MDPEGAPRCVQCGVRLARDNAGGVCSACRRQAREHPGRAPVMTDDFWRTEEMQQALVSREMGRISRAYRHHPFHGDAPLPQARLAEWLNLTQGQLSRIERGLHPVRDLDSLVHWAVTLRLPPHLAWFELPGRSGHQGGKALETTREGDGAESAETAGPAKRPAVTEAGLQRDNLPADLTRFLGRGREVAEVRRLLNRHRLVTLTGTGGVGKTRLALQVARGLVQTVADGVWWTELGSLSDADLVPQAVAAATGTRPATGRTALAPVVDALRGRHLLLVLDNCEHLVSACARLVEAVGRACPHIRVLATSREPLRCAGEAVWHVPAFELPVHATPTAPSVAELRRYDAVELFAERAAASGPGFALTDGNAAAVAAICRRLDGLPLAIELAAARVGGLPVEQLAARLDDRFRLLAGSRTAEPRHQTLRATVEWSYALLSAGEQALFDRLSVFAGGFTLEAVEAVTVDRQQVGPVASPPPLAPTDVLTTLLGLVDKSLVVREGTTGNGDDVRQRSGEGAERYRLLETLREYGRERLESDADGAAGVRDRHLAYHLGLIEAAGAVMPAGPQDAALRRLEAARDDVWAALAWARERDDAGASRRLGGALAGLAERLTSPAVRRVLTPLLSETRRLGLPAYAAVEGHLLEQSDPEALTAGANLYWVIGDWTAEGALARRREEIQAAGGAVSVDATASARAQLGAARPLVFRRSLAEALALLEELEAVAVRHGDDGLRLDVLLERGYAHWHTGDCTEGRRAYAAARALLEHLRSHLGEAAHRAKLLAALRGSGLIEHNAEENATSLDFHTAARDLAQETGDAPEETLARLNVADAQWGLGQYGLALSGFDAALAAPHAAYFARGRAALVLGRGVVLGSMGRYPEAADFIAEGLDGLRGLGDVWFEAYGLVYQGFVLAGLGDLDGALHASGAAVELAAQHGVGYPLALAQAHLLWQEELRAPGHPDRASQIAAALAGAERLGLRGPTTLLRWVRLLHRVADPALPAGAVRDELEHTLRTAAPRPPIKGSWELIGQDAIRLLAERHPDADRASLEALVEREIGTKAATLHPDERQRFRDTRLLWRPGR